MEKQPTTSTNPAPKGKHPQDMTPEERLASMRAFADEQKYIQPGGGEIIPYNSADGEGGFNSVIFGNPLQGPTSFRMATDGYKGSLPPPSYETLSGRKVGEEEKKERRGSLRRLFGKGEKGEKEEGKEKEKEKGDGVIR